MQIDKAADAIVARLKAAGISASTDPRDLNPPAVWVTLDRVVFGQFRADTWAGDWVLWAVAPDAGTGPSWRALGDLADKVRAVFVTISEGTAQALVLPAGGDPLPALRFPLSLKAVDDLEPATLPADDTESEQS